MRLLLIRHGQAGNAPLDVDRPLTEHGAAQAEALGSWLAGRSLVPDRVLVSPARRAAQTWAAAATRLTAPPPPTVDERIYENTFDTVLAAIRETPDGVRCLAVVGHNPSLAALADELARDPREGGLPAGGVAVLELPGTFAALAPGTATLSGVHLPGR